MSEQDSGPVKAGHLVTTVETELRSTSTSKTTTSKPAQGDVLDEEKPFQDVARENTVQLFELFQDLFPDNYLEMFPGDSKEDVRRIKRLWMEQVCSRFHWNLIQLAALKAATPVPAPTGGFYPIAPPTIGKFLAIINDIRSNQKALPTPQQAYFECSHNAHRKHDHQWSHPIVYLAAQKADLWHLIKTEAMDLILPMYTNSYEQLKRRVQEGEDLEVPVYHAIEDKSDATAAINILDLAEDLGIDDSLAYELFSYTLRDPNRRETYKLYEQAIARGKTLGLNTSLFPSIPAPPRQSVPRRSEKSTRAFDALKKSIGKL